MFEQALVEEFLFEGRRAVVVRPTTPANGCWIWKAEYFGAFPNFEEAMVQRGYHVCFVEHETRWAPDSEVELSCRFLRHIAATYQLDTRGIAVGMSCGGLMATRLAEAHPELIDVLYLDAPVMNLLSMAGLGEMCDPAVHGFVREITNTYRCSREQLVTFRRSPIDNMQPLLDHRIPVILLYGNADPVVLYRENGAVLEDFYRKNGGTLRVICKSMVEHHPHGLDDPQPIIDFVEAHRGEAI